MDCNLGLFEGRMGVLCLFLVLFGIKTCNFVRVAVASELSIRPVYMEKKYLKLSIGRKVFMSKVKPPVDFISSKWPYCPAQWICCRNLHAQYTKMIIS